MTDSESMPAKTANPAPLGLLGFGMTTILLSLHNAGITELDDVTLAMGVFCGGLAQLLAGIMEYRNGNTFGTVAFTMYGMFWLAFVAIKLDVFGMGHNLTNMGSFCLIWGLMTLVLFIGTLKGRVALCIVFATLTITFLLLSVADFMGNGTITNIAGFVGILCGAAAFYTASAEILLEQHGREILPF